VSDSSVFFYKGSRACSLLPPVGLLSGWGSESTLHRQLRCGSRCKSAQNQFTCLYFGTLFYFVFCLTSDPWISGDSIIDPVDKFFISYNSIQMNLIDVLLNEQSDNYVNPTVVEIIYLFNELPTIFNLNWIDYVSRIYKFNNFYPYGFVFAVGSLPHIVRLGKVLCCVRQLFMYVSIEIKKHTLISRVGCFFWLFCYL